MSQSVGKPIEGGRYAIILGDGSIREASNENNPDAVKREYETKDGGKKVKWEIPYSSLVGKIKNVYFRDSDFGEQLKLTVEGPEGDRITLSTSADSNFASDIMKKLPNVDFEKTYVILPWSLTDERGKERRGVSFKHGEEKVENYFYDGTKNVNGFPEPEGDTTVFTKDDWKIYFLKVKSFLTNHTKENICPKFEQDAKKVLKEGQTTPGVDYPAEDINPDDIPF